MVGCKILDGIFALEKLFFVNKGDCSKQDDVLNKVHNLVSVFIQILHKHVKVFRFIHLLKTKKKKVFMCHVHHSAFAIVLLFRQYGLGLCKLKS